MTFHHESKTPSPTKIEFIDTHCHLDMTEYDEDRSELFRRFRQAGIKTVITIGIDYESSVRAVQLAEHNEDIRATIGIHPHDVAKIAHNTYNNIETLFQTSSGIVGYGEIGLDYCKGYTDPQTQREHFARQLDLAHACKLPVVIHNRDADEDTYAILRRAKPLDYGGVMHCYSGDLAFAEKIIDLNMHISIPGIVTFKNARVLQKVAARIPLARMLLETDGPFLAPHPFRGKRNEPSYLLYTAHKVAELRELPIVELAQQTTKNAEKLFQLNTEKTDDC